MISDRVSTTNTSLCAVLVAVASISLTASDGAAQVKLLLQSVCVIPNAGEFIAIYNPGLSPVSLANYYIYDAYHHTSNTSYIYMADPSSGTPGGGQFNDMNRRFPSGSILSPHDTIAVALHGAADYQSVYGRKPHYEIVLPGSNDAAVPDMLPAANTGEPPSAFDAATLANSGESVLLYYWDGSTDLVVDVDYMFWGQNTASYVINKTGKAVDGPDAER
jgi:hypothetical protein